MASIAGMERSVAVCGAIPPLTADPWCFQWMKRGASEIAVKGLCRSVRQKRCNWRGLSFPIVPMLKRGNDREVPTSSSCRKKGTAPICPPLPKSVCIFNDHFRSLNCDGLITNPSRFIGLSFLSVTQATFGHEQMLPVFCSEKSSFEKGLFDPAITKEYVAKKTNMNICSYIKR